MAELTKEELDRMDYTEDEFGIGLKAYLYARAGFYLIGTFMILGALLALVCGATTFNDLVSNATALSANSPVLNDNFNGLQLCMIVQAVVTIGSLVSIVLLILKRSRLFALIDLGLFVVLVAVFFIMGSMELLSNGSAWILYFLLNPIWSFIALFAGKHWQYMPMMK